MSDLHAAIMNIHLGNGVSSGAGELVAYKTGHRDARHAAAELALASDARIAELEAENAALKRGESICAKCGLRQDSTNECSKLLKD
jgi:hypothetical protein